MFAAETIYSTQKTDDIFDRTCIRKIMKISWSDFHTNNKIKDSILQLIETGAGHQKTSQNAGSDTKDTSSEWKLNHFQGNYL